MLKLTWRQALAFRLRRHHTAWVRRAAAEEADRLAAFLGGTSTFTLKI